MKTKLFILSLLVAGSELAFSQGVLSDQSSFSAIETAIRNKKDLVLTLQKVNQINQDALKSGDDVSIARSLYYRMLIQDQRSEDTSYFKNSAFIDSSLYNNKSSVKLKVLLHLLQAKRLSIFNYRYLKFKRDRYETPKLLFNYAAFSKKQLDSVIENHINRAVDLASGIKRKKKDTEAYKWISSVPDIFLFEPHLADIIFTERLSHHIKASPPSGPFIAGVNDWIDLPASDFQNKLDSISSIDNKDHTILQSYNTWMRSRKNNPEVAGFIETLIRKYLYETNRYDSTSKAKYIRYLERSANSDYTLVRVHSVYQLCLFWNEEGQRYVYGYEDKYQFLPAKALALYEKNKNLMADYIRFDQILEEMKRKILSKSFTMKMEDMYLPGDPVLIHANYKNTEKLFYRIIKTSAAEHKAQSTGKLLNKTEILKGVFNLPLPEDHNYHAAFLKLDSLQSGHYHLLFSDQEPGTAYARVNTVPFIVTDISAINTDERVYVLNRRSGMPLQNAQVKAFYYKRDSRGNRTPSRLLKSTLKVNHEGFVTVSNNPVDELHITHQGDTLHYDFDTDENKPPRVVFNPDDYNDPEEFYDDEAVLHIYTDRGIYRPGQTVHYKAILLTRDPQTGEMILFNEKNLKKTGASMKRWLEDMEPELFLIDAFNRNIDSVKLAVNDFGSFSGSFVIPKTAATGEWTIEPDLIDNNYQNSGRFRVEEYKRPSFELTMEKPKKTLLPGDPFMLKVAAKSFSGANLNNIPVRYVVSRSGQYRVFDAAAKSYLPTYENVKVLDTTLYADVAGEIEFMVNDRLLKKRDHPGDRAWSYTYQVKATAVDATGETAEIESSLSVSTRPYQIHVGISQVYDRQMMPEISLSVNSELEGKVDKQVKVSVYKVIRPKVGNGYPDKVDQWLYPREQLKQWFPDIALETEEKTVKTLVYETIVHTSGTEKFTLPKDKFPAGNYELTAVCLDTNQNKEDIIRGQAVSSFKVFDTGDRTVPDADFSYLAYNQVNPGDTVKLYTASSDPIWAVYQVHYFTRNKEGKTIKKAYQQFRQDAGLQEFILQIPEDAAEQLLLTKVYISNNKIHRGEERLYIVKKEEAEPEIIIERYRKILAPGAKETFSVSLKTKNEHTVAELMTTLYDASLDKLQGHSWNKPAMYADAGYLSSGWPYSLSSQISKYLNFDEDKNDQIIGSMAGDSALEISLQGRVHGLSVTDAQGLNEVVVSYGSQTKKMLTGSQKTIRIRGINSLSEYNQPLIILDGVVYEGGLSSLDAASISEALVLKGAEASVLYGARAANGVLVLSTKGPIKLPGEEADPVVKIRKDFNETAFFFPEVYADKDGFFTFNFTMPETATAWNWKMLAHTKTAKFAYTERKLNTQLSLMVQPNMPRLLYQGDEINLQSRISNLDTLAIQGKIICKIEDMVTGQDLTSAMVTKTHNDFSVDKKQTTSSAFLLKVPQGQLNPLKIVISAVSGSFSDAEEHIIPVLTTRVFVRQSQPVRFSQADTVLQSPAFPADAELYGLALSIHPKPQAALLNALPWLANYSFDCSEQSFNKLLAHATALRMMQTDTIAQKAYQLVVAEAAADTLKKSNESLPDELAAMAMPWLNLDNKTVKQQEQLRILLDTLHAKSMIKNHLEKLYQLQNKDGGLAWFQGGGSNPYISDYVLAGFGKLNKDGWKAEAENEQTNFINRLAVYCDEQFSKKKPEVSLRYMIYDDLHYIYGRSFWLNNLSEIDITPAALSKIKARISEKWKSAENAHLSQQAMLIITSFRYFKPQDSEYKKAVDQLSSIRQLAIEDPLNGIRWKDIADADDLSSSSEETMALIAEAFDEIPANQDAKINRNLHSGLMKWLLTAKSDHNWQTTKATAAAVDLLKRDRASVIGQTQHITAAIKADSLSVSDAILNGVPFDFIRTTERPSSLSFSKKNAQPAAGDVSWYYFTSSGNLDSLNKQVRLKKTLYHYLTTKDRVEGSWSEVKEDATLKTGDRVKVVLTIQTAKPLRFVHIDDKRAAAFEPADNLSGYQHQDGVSYYRSIRDTGVQLFAEFIPSGKSEISYELIVAREGKFEHGASVLQCMYQPAVTAYSNSEKVTTLK